MTAPLRARMYLRVSTKPRKVKPGDPPEALKPGQTVENQRPVLEQIARARGFEITGEYPEAESTKKRRPVFEQMMEDARLGAFDVLLIWALDRFGRDHVGNMIDVRELDRLGVRIVSAEEPWMDTTGPTRGLLVSIFSWVAEQERERRSERTKAGLERARAQGKEPGRPKSERRTANEARVLELKARKRSVRSIAMATGIPRSTVQSIIRASRKRGAANAPDEATNPGPGVPSGGPCQ